MQSTPVKIVIYHYEQVHKGELYVVLEVLLQVDQESNTEWRDIRDSVVE